MLREGWGQAFTRMSEPYIRYMRWLLELPCYHDGDREELVDATCQIIWNMVSGSDRYDKWRDYVEPLIEETRFDETMYECTDQEHIDEMSIRASARLASPPRDG